MGKLEETAERLFGDALDLPREQRTAFLDRVCAGNPRLRQMIDDLPSTNDRLSGFLSEPPFRSRVRCPRQTSHPAFK
jgi:hypothetical protein